ncbi:MAG: hypothetical protein JWM88_894 [Verrucomicrobia bacterium]|nr:hypothetical protein [Verrucomicrobiota bacterium]
MPKINRSNSRDRENPRRLRPFASIDAACRRWLLAALLAGIAAPTPIVSAAKPDVPARAIMRETLVDFPDDCAVAGRTLVREDIEALMTKLAGLGIRRVSWAYYGDGHGGFLVPEGFREASPYQGDEPSDWKNLAATYRALGNPLKVAVEAGHRHGIEVYAYYKPYETGPGVMFPEGTELAKRWGVLPCIGQELVWMDPFVRDHPELRIQRRTDDLPEGVASTPIAALTLTKKDAAPTRVTAEHLQIWTSPNNFQYQPKRCTFSLSESVEPSSREVRDQMGRVVTKKGDPVRVLRLTGLDLRDKFVLVTTDFAEGKPDFANSGLALLTAWDSAGREIPGCVASGGTVWGESLVDFRKSGVMFDYGWGAGEVTLDAPNHRVQKIPTAELPLDAAENNGKQGFIAFARGRNAYLPGALCETEPAVRAFWLRNLDEIIAAGVDGVDFREESHSTHTDHPGDYGFNPAVLAEARKRPGNLLANISAVRGEAYTSFLQESHARLAKAGRKMRYNLQIDFFRDHPPTNRLLAYPANIRFEWAKWIGGGMLDGAILRFFSLPFDVLFHDDVTQEMISRAQAAHLPIAVNRYIDTAGDKLADEFARVATDPRFDSFIFYEVSSFISFGAKPGECVVKNPRVLKALAAHHDAP